MLTRYDYHLGFIEIFMEGGGDRISSHSLKKSGVGRLQTQHPEKDDKLDVYRLCSVLGAHVHICVGCEACLVLLLALWTSQHLEHLLLAALDANF